jgi:hypothetical protein
MQSKNEQAGSMPLHGSDAGMEFLHRNRIPVTRENYLDWAYPEGQPEWTAELESMLPDELQIQDSKEIDWDLLDDLETDPAQLDQDLVISQMLRDQAKTAD